MPYKQNNRLPIDNEQKQACVVNKSENKRCYVWYRLQFVGILICQNQLFKKKMNHLIVI